MEFLGKHLIKQTLPPRFHDEEEVGHSFSCGEFLGSSFSRAMSCSCITQGWAMAWLRKPFRLGDGLVTKTF